jgi:hypothetical protein
VEARRIADSYLTDPTLRRQAIERIENSNRQQQSIFIEGGTR